MNPSHIWDPRLGGDTIELKENLIKSLIIAKSSMKKKKIKIKNLEESTETLTVNKILDKAK